MRISKSSLSTLSAGLTGLQVNLTLFFILMLLVTCQKLLLCKLDFRKWLTVKIALGAIKTPEAQR
jgi:hypothetical protein